MKTRPVSSDARYTVTREFTGHASGKRQFVLRFCGDWIDSFTTYPAAVIRAVGESARRRGALVITEITKP
jgi:hypothetical protein